MDSLENQGPALGAGHRLQTPRSATAPSSIDWHCCAPGSFRKRNSGTFPTSDPTDGDSGKDMPFRFLDVDAKVDPVRSVAHLVLQNDLSFFFRRVVRLEQAWGHVRRARTSDTEDAGILIGNGPHIGWVHGRLRV